MSLLFPTVVVVIIDPGCRSRCPGTAKGKPERRRKRRGCLSLIFTAHSHEEPKPGFETSFALGITATLPSFFREKTPNPKLLTLNVFSRLLGEIVVVVEEEEEEATADLRLPYPTFGIPTRDIELFRLQYTPWCSFTLSLSLFRAIGIMLS